MTVTFTAETLGLLWLGAFVGALVAGAAGFAFALTSSSIWLHALDPVHTTVLVVACGSLLHCILVWRLRSAIEPVRLTPFLAGGIVGVPLGVALLAATDPGVLKLTLGAFLIAYGLYTLAAPRLPLVTGGGRVADGVVGFFGGILGGLGGYSGVLPTIWTQLRGWPKHAARGVYQPFILAAHLATLALVGAVGLDWTGLVLIAVALPMLAAGAWLGWMLYGRLDERLFRKLLAVALALSGLTLVF